MPHALLLIAACISSQVEDIHFRRVVEDWTITAARPRRLTDVLPEPDARLLRCLGSNDYDARYLADRVIRERGPRAFRLLCVGCRSTDAEIRHRSEALLDRLYTCPSCDGDGRCRACGRLGGLPFYCAACTAGPYRRWGLCRRCGGTGNLNHPPEPEEDL